MIRHLCTLQNDHHKSGYHLSPYRVNTLLSTIVPMLCMTSLWLIIICELIFLCSLVFIPELSVLISLSVCVPLFLGFLESLPCIFLILLSLSLCLYLCFSLCCLSGSPYLKKFILSPSLLLPQTASLTLLLSPVLFLWVFVMRIGHSICI